MRSNYKRSWTLVFHAASKMRDQAFCMGDADIEKLTIAQERVLQVVYRESPQGVKLKDIAKQVQLTPGAVSQIIESLVKFGMVERVSDPNDRRAVNIHVSQKGENQRQRTIELFDREFEEVLAESTPEEREGFIAIMEKIVQKFSDCRVSTRRYAGETLLSMEEYK